MYRLALVDSYLQYHYCDTVLNFGTDRLAEILAFGNCIMSPHTTVFVIMRLPSFCCGFQIFVDLLLTCYVPCMHSGMIKLLKWGLGICLNYCAPLGLQIPTLIWYCNVTCETVWAAL